jgi:cysteine desulfurase / selenocysteine lyase
MEEISSYRDLFVGLEMKVPLLNGESQDYINLDNAASTPSLKAVQKQVNDFLLYYSSVHRGTGFKSQLSTQAYEKARHIVLDFFGAHPSEHTCIFVKNTTEAVNKLARRLPFNADHPIVLTSGMEHHSNDLPWRAVSDTIHVPLTPKGELDEPAYDALLKKYQGRVALVAITGASNVTGLINPVHRLAEKAHAAGALIFIDCAQYAPHRKIELLSLADPAHLDFIAISAHKMYAPFGVGALVGRKDIFESGDPDQRGGGTVEIVTLEDVVWADPPDREEAGSPNTVGAIALAAAIRQLEAVGMEQVAAHEADLTAYALQRLTAVPGLQIFGERDPGRAAERLGVIPFKLAEPDHFLTAAVLGYEFGIGVRSGCFCAHPYILHLLGLNQTQATAVRDTMLAGDRSQMPGLIRVSFGLYNTPKEVDRLIEALNRITRGEYQGVYLQDRATGEYTPQGWQVHFHHYFSF